MSVYVDDLAEHGWRLGPSCHLFADSVPELHAFADRLGLKRAWFQLDEGKRRPIPHYDLTAKRRAAAVALGAVEVDRRQAVTIWRRLCPLPTDPPAPGPSPVEGAAGNETQSREEM